MNENWVIIILSNYCKSPSWKIQLVLNSENSWGDVLVVFFCCNTTKEIGNSKNIY